MKSNEIWPHLTKFLIIKLWFWSILLYFFNFPFCFQWFQKFTTKFCPYMDWFKICKFLTWQWHKLKKSISQLPSHYNPLVWSFVCCSTAFNIMGLIVPLSINDDHHCHWMPLCWLSHFLIVTLKVISLICANNARTHQSGTAAFSIMTLSLTIRKCDSQHNNIQPGNKKIWHSALWHLMPMTSVVLLTVVYAEWGN